MGSWGGMLLHVDNKGGVIDDEPVRRRTLLLAEDRSFEFTMSMREA